MSVIVRGIKNAFRNWMRTAGVICILAIGIGFALSMLIARQAVTDKVGQLKSNLGTNVTINPAGSRDFQGGGEPLTTANVATVSKVAHVSAVTSTVNFRLQNETVDTTNQTMSFAGSKNAASGKTNLQSAIDPGTLGRRANGDNVDFAKPTFRLPIAVSGVSGATDQSGKALKIISGRALSTADANQNNAVIGSELATKNNLKVGSTFTAYDSQITVVGIYDQGTKFENAGILMPLATAQRLSSQPDQINAIVAQVDSIDNIDSTVTAIKNALGSNKVDVSSSQQNAQTAIDGLRSVENISFVGFIAATIAAGVIIFFITLVIVRERRREIGVMKAIGSSTHTIIIQFMAEAMVLVIIGAALGLAVSLVSGNAITQALVSSNADSATQDQGPSLNAQGPGGKHIMRLGGGGFKGQLDQTANIVGTITTNVGWLTLAGGAIATILIGMIGSALPAWFIAKIRPAEALRSE